MKNNGSLFFLVLAVTGFFGARCLNAQTNSSAPPSLDTLLKWDTERIDVTVTNGTPEAHFTFNLTNVSAEVVTITAANSTCFCTVASLPEEPWKIAPGTNGQINATMNLVNKSGSILKVITVESDKGTKLLYVQSTILPAPAPSMETSAMDRATNQKLAIADRQGVFKGECARCHAEPAKGKFGQPLYIAVCGVCHEAEHRATMVPNLHALPHENNAELWRNWIAHGKPGTLMPAFSVAEGGILTDEQINSVVSYLVETIPSRPAVPASKPAASAR
jgi:mono/diheme cytochrome c family protein